VNTELTTQRDHHPHSCWHLTGPNQFEAGVVNEHPIKLRDGAVQVRILWNGDCESDHNVARAGKHQGQAEGNNRIILGHEPVGEVIKLGHGACHLRVGQRVALEPGISCGNCLECHSGRYNLCRKVRYMATPSAGWSYGSYVRTVQWPAALCHVVPEDLDPMVAALAEAMAAARQAIDHLAETPKFDPEREVVILVGFGQMAVLILLHLKRRWPNLRVIVLARKEEDRQFALTLGADHALALSGLEWDTAHKLEHLLHVADKPDASMEEVRAQIETIRRAEAHNQKVHAHNLESFREARELAGQEVACVIECTGQGHVMTAAMESRTVRGNGTYGLVSCLYRVSIDVAWLRRDGATVWNLRRSRNRFRDTLLELARHPDYYRQCIGHVTHFDNIPNLYRGEKGEKVGPGPKTMIQYV